MSEQPKILALSGRKQSGKNTSFNYLLGLVLCRLWIVRTQFEVKPNGTLYLADMFGNEKMAGYMDIDRQTREMDQFRGDVYPFIRNYSFADILKRDICVGLLGLEWEQCYGTDEQKQAETHLLWENMPGVVTPDVINPIQWQYNESSSDFDVLATTHEPGPMTGREVMQYVGTEIFRKMYHDIWANGTIKQITEYGSLMSVITDCRFPNEVAAVQNAGGKVVRFTRNPHPDDTHPSETSLDKSNYNWDNFDIVIDNQDMSIPEQNKALYEELLKIGWIDPIKIPETV